MRKEIDLLGDHIHSEQDFHKEIKQLLSLPSYYNEDLDSLYEFLSSYVEKRLTINWLNHKESMKSLGNDFDRILETLQLIERNNDEFILLLN